MKNQISRRDFLKIAGLFPLGIAAPIIADSLAPTQQSGKSQNVIIVVFDAFSAYNISLYGYQRETTPNLTRLAERAVVYHNHYAGGNFTTPGTASLLTGTYPWKHRAFNHGGRVDNQFVKKNLFASFENYYRLTYSHNRFANIILRQFTELINDHVAKSRLLLTDNTQIPDRLFNNDDDIATVGWRRALESREEGFSYSLFFSHLLRAIEELQKKKLVELQPQFPRGLPRVFSESYFMLEDAIDFFGSTFENLPKPFISYLHFMPPHSPYRTHREFYGRFEGDNFKPQFKPLDLFFRDADIEKTLNKLKLYDEFILYVDREFGRFFDYLESSSLLDNTWIIITSDHGEMFERGINGHVTPVLYEPVIRIPLMIFEPGRKTRLDIHTPTSAIDILPTLLHVTGQQQANWTDGEILPPYSATYLDEAKSIYISETKNNEKNKSLTVATIALVKGDYKLMYFYGYEELEGRERIELYDVRNDPQEMKNLYNVEREKADEMVYELKKKLAQADAPYQ